jgi:hypothetical protein
VNGTLTHVEGYGAVVEVMVRGEGQTRVVAVDARAWEEILEARGGLEHVIGATVEVVGAGAAASLRFADEPGHGGR